ncbi:MAG: toll/interleukin-1 receptor domain-containing protein [Firmicutes bacterium]|nr:toll/interleukin-1 receptor domain-containing protein [Bacillota bacterium]
MKAYNGLYPYAFMSYSHKDEDRIAPLIDKLQSVGCNIWYDEGILPADEWAETVAKKLSGATLFFLILSANSIASQNVKREIYYAVSNNIPILTFYLENVELSQGLNMQLGISQSIHTKNDVDIDYDKIKNIFPKDIITDDVFDIIHSTPKFVYAFSQKQALNEYSIIQIDRETRQRKILFLHKDSAAFIADYRCESLHISPSNEFNSNQETTLFFSIYSDLDHDAGVPASDLYVQSDFAITNPNSNEAILHILGGRMKQKNDSYVNTKVFSNSESVYWLKNYVDDE